MFKELFSLNYTNEQMKEVINSLGISLIVVNLLGPLFIFNLLYEKVNTIFLIFWLLSQLSVVVIRVFVGKRFYMYLEKNIQEKIKKYFLYYLWIIFVSGALWGLMFFVAILYLPSSYLFFIFSLVFAVTSGSIITLGAVYLASFIFILTATLPTAIALLIVGDSFLHYIEVVLIIIYLISILKIGHKNRELAIEGEKNSILLDQYLDITDRSIIISKTDLNGFITHVNDNFCKISGYKREELIGKNHNMVRHPEVPKSTFKKMWEVISKDKKTWQGVLKNRAKNGDSYYVSTTVSPILDRDNNIREYISLRHDITAIMSDKKQLFDYLETNKLNVLIMIQIEDYGTLEKFYDKSTVEEIEKRFGSAILYLLPNRCDFRRVYYLENGLYALAKSRRLCKESKDNIENTLKEFLQNVKEYMVKLDKIEYDISAVCSFTYGVIQTYEDTKIGIEKAIEEKKSIVYADGLSGVEYAIALQNIETLHTLKVAIEDKKVISYFQPIVDNTTKKVCKYESLVRIVDEFGRVVQPSEFIDIAKKGRYYSQVTKIVLDNSFKTLLETDKSISINLSALDIESIDMQKKIFHLLEAYKEHSNRVVFELLESEDIKNFDVIVSFIRNVKQKGVKIAIDDFGTGYSNFSRLLQYEPDLLKIDGSLIKNIKDNELSRNIVETIVLFAKKQKIKTVAEFVENEEIYNIVKELGIDYSQGYAFGKPQELY